MQNQIAFPGLGLGPFSLSKGFSIGFMTVRWYGILIACGVILAYLFSVKKGEKRGITRDTLLDIVLWGLPLAVVCARIYYVVFSWEYYRNHPEEIIRIWEGGIAIYGAVIGAVLSTYIYCRVKKIPFRQMIDVGAFGLLIGQIIGRWGNFVNAEAYGSETATSLFRMELVDLGITVHPTFLYESCWNLLVFLVLNLYERYQKFDGELFFVYLTGYGFGRFFIEGIRTDSLFFGPIRISQFVALLCVFIGISLIIFGRRRVRKNMTM